MKTVIKYITSLAIIMIISLSLLTISCMKSETISIETKDNDGLEITVPGSSKLIPNVPVGPDGKLKIVSDVPDMPFVFHPKSLGKNSSIWKFMEVEKAEALIITFWSTWSKPSLTELPYLEKIYRKYKSKGLSVLAISFDQENPFLENKITQILESDEIMEISWRKLGKYSKSIDDSYVSFPIALDDSREILNALGIETLPQTLLVTKNYQVYFHLSSFDELDSINLEEKVMELLARNHKPGIELLND